MASTSHKARRPSVLSLGVILVTLVAAGVFLATCGDGGGSDGEVTVDTTVFGRVLSAIDEAPMEGVTETTSDELLADIRQILTEDVVRLQ